MGRALIARRGALFFLLAFLLLPAAGIAAAPPAQFAPHIITNSIAVSFPETAVFALEWEGAGVTAVTLRYDVQQVSCLEAAAEIEVDFSDGSATWTWEMVRSGNPPPGATITWEWELTSADGDIVVTPAQQYAFVDERYEWQTVAADNVRLHWYAGQDVGPMLLEAAVAGLDRLQNEMGITLRDEVQFFIYGDSDDMRDAVLYIQDWAGGVAFTEYNIILIGVPPSTAESWGRPTVRHELAHLVVAQFGRSCRGGSRPTWLEEGLAVYAEGSPSERVAAEIAIATANDSFSPLRTLSGSFAAHSADAGLAYSQSYSVVNFMLAAYGQEKMQELLLTLAAGTPYDAALEQVFGFNVDGLDAAWRQAQGLPERTFAPTPTPLSAAAVPTILPLGAPVNVPTPPAAAATAVPGDGGAAIPALCNLLVLPLALVTLARRGRERNR